MSAEINLGHSRGLFFLALLNKVCMNFSSPVCYMHYPPHPPLVKHHKEEYILCYQTLCTYLHPAVTSHLG